MAAVSAPGLILILLAVSSLGFGQVSACGCDPDDPKTLEARECGLTREAIAQPPGKPVFFLKDNNPRKPNRWLALPRAVRKEVCGLSNLTAGQRLDLWAGAIAKAGEFWGNDWGLAYNGDDVRSQCHPHIHIGKLIEGVETPRFIEVDGAAQIPVPAKGEGLWVHPWGGKLHVHVGELLTEAVLLR
jgi:hypothetical protein